MTDDRKSPKDGQDRAVAGTIGPMHNTKRKRRKEKEENNGHGTTTTTTKMNWMRPAGIYNYLYTNVTTIDKYPAVLWFHPRLHHVNQMSDIFLCL